MRRHFSVFGLKKQYFFGRNKIFAARKRKTQLGSGVERALQKIRRFLNLGRERTAAKDQLLFAVGQLDPYFQSSSPRFTVSIVAHTEEIVKTFSPTGRFFSVTSKKIGARGKQGKE